MQTEPIHWWLEVDDGQEIEVKLRFDYSPEEPTTYDCPGHPTEVVVNEAIVVTPGPLCGDDILDQLDHKELESYIMDVMSERNKKEQELKHDQEAEYADHCYQEWKEEGVPMWQHRRP